MADKITWADKESLVTDPTIAEKNKVTDNNINEIKSVTNTNADELAEKIVYDENDITENTSILIEEVPEGSNIPYINSEIAIGSSNQDNRPVWFKQGKNLFSSLLELGTYSDAGIKSSSSTNYRNVTPIAVRPNTIYTFSINGTSQKYAIYYYDNTNTFISSEGLTTGTFTTPANCYYINFRCFNADFTNDYASLKLQIELGNTATAYEPYITPRININGENLFYANDYSTTEQVVGTWINGKPLYRKVIETTNPVVSTDGGTQSRTIAVDPNIEFIYIESAIMISSTNTYTTPTMTMSGNRVWRVDGDIANKGFQIFTNNTSWSELPVKVIARYTKTTD